MLFGADPLIIFAFSNRASQTFTDTGDRLRVIFGPSVSSKFLLPGCTVSIHRPWHVHVPFPSFYCLRKTSMFPYPDPAALFIKQFPSTMSLYVSIR
jgi:hypothetical protein